MNENSRRWLEALRSGRFQQTRGALRHGDYRCCLGVACDLFAEQGLAQGKRFTDHGIASGFLALGVWGDEDGSGRRAFIAGDECCLGPLPDVVRRWLGLRTTTGETTAERASLVELNDTGTSFGRIADVIESEPDGLFE
jgi:hypothetical protein